MFKIFSMIHLLFLFYTVLLFLRILASWLPYHIQRHKFMQLVARCTDPYLLLFRRILPPLGGMLDLSPILAFFVLKLLEMLVLWILQILFRI